jgi:hypothetical protein
MSYPEITAPRMAQILGQIDNLDADGINELHNRIRNLARKGFLTPVDDPNYTATSARRYPLTEMVRAFILANAVEYGFASEALAEIAASLKGQLSPHVITPDCLHGVTISGALHAAILATKAGEEFVLRVRGEKQGDKVVWIAEVRWAGHSPSQRANDIIDLEASVRGFRTIARTEFSLSALIRPLLPLLMG